MSSDNLGAELRSFGCVLYFRQRLRTPYSFGSVPVSGQLSGQGRLLAKFFHAESTRVLKALSRDLPVIAQLNDPESPLDSENLKSANCKTTDEARFGGRLKAG